MATTEPESALVTNAGDSDWPEHGLPPDHEAMQKSDLIAGRTYALRVRRQSLDDEPFAKVKFKGKTHKDQVHVRHEAGHLAGLEEWVRTRHLACPWGDRKALQHDEERMSRLREVSSDRGDRVTEEAISAVFTASGEYGGFMRIWNTDLASAQRLWDRAGLSGSPLEHHPANFIDRSGTWQLTFHTALHAAEAFAAAEPETVDLYLRGWEDRLRAEGFIQGNQHSHELLREWAPSHALARSWSQKPIGVAAEREVQRLRSLVEQAVGLLRAIGHDSEAARIERGLNGR